MLLFSISSYIAEDIAGASSTFLLGAAFAGAACAGVALGLDAAAMTSSFRMRPTGPLPTIPSSGIPCSLAVFLARGLAKSLSPEALATAGALD